MALQRLTIRAAAPILVLRKAEELGFKREVLLQKTGLTAEELSHPDKRVPREKLSRLWVLIEKMGGGRFFGVTVGASVSIADMGIVGYIMRFSQSLGEAMTKLENYGRLLADDVELKICRDNDDPRIELDANINLVAIRHPIHCRLAIIVSVVRNLISSDFKPKVVHLPELRVNDGQELRDFFRCPLEFGSGKSSVTIESEDWAQKLDSCDSHLGHYLESYADYLMDRQPSQASLIDQIEYLLSAKLSSGDPGLSGIAKELAMSPRSLQRLLSNEGTKYKDVLDHFRHEMALDLLRNPKLSIKEIAFMLGYHEASGFYRAFHRWKNCPPNRFREAQTAGRHYDE